MNRRAFLTLSGACAGAGLPLARFARLLAQTRAERPGPVVTTAGGRVRGVSDGAVRIFRGVPYGASTAGANRFQPPRAAAAWTGVRDAGSYGLRAFQPLRPMIPEIGDALTGSGPMSEDCLRLNVFTPGTNGRRPVMVWFHGGGQRTGSGNSIFYDGRELARQHDVVVVTTTHRLNAFAYLWLAGLPGTGSLFAECVNLGLRDLVLALEWVRDNIARFGGDAGNVTIFGQSGGGGKTAMLTAFPAARGLFHRAIIMSTLAETAVSGLRPDRATEAAELLLRRLDVQPAQAARLLAMPAERVINALSSGPDLSLRFVPVVDGATLPADPFSPASPLSATVPILTGSNECEGIPYGNPDDPVLALGAGARRGAACPPAAARADERCRRDEPRRALPLASRRADRRGSGCRDRWRRIGPARGRLRDRRSEARTGSRAGLPVSLQLAIAAARRPAAQHARHGAAVRVRASGPDQLLDGDGR